MKKKNENVDCLYGRLNKSILFSFYSCTKLVYVVVGHYSEHIGLMLSLYQKGLLENGQYFVVGVDVEHYNRLEPQRYFKGTHSHIKSTSLN